MLIRLHRLYYLAVAASVLLTVATTASAYWTGTGTGSGTAATAGGTQPVTLSARPASAQLYPGGTGDVVAEVTNGNAAPVHVPSLQLDTDQGASGYAVDAPGCTLAGLLAYTTQTNGGAGWTFPAGTSSLTLNNAVAMAASAANGCQGATFTIHLKAGA